MGGQSNARQGWPFKIRFIGMLLAVCLAWGGAAGIDGGSFFQDPVQSASAQAYNSPRPLGSVTVLNGPYSCNGTICYDLQVSCSSLAQAGQLTIKVGEPTGSPEKGTIIFFSGWTGTYYWENTSTEAPRVLNELRAAGYRTIDTIWASSWWQGAQNLQEGYALLACKAATVIQWVHDNTSLHNASLPYCATGYSNGASEVAYSISQYGQAGLFSTVLFDSGPNFARLDHACIQDDPNYSNLWFPNTVRANVDQSFGYLTYGSGPCYAKDPNYRPTLQDRSVAFGNWQFYYPGTLVSFAFGETDTTTTRYHGQFFYDFMVQAGSPHLSMDVIPGTGHAIVGTTVGANYLRDHFIGQCVPRTPTAIDLQVFGVNNSQSRLILLISGVVAAALMIVLVLAGKQRIRSISITLND
jgi:hypothetical protein